LTLNQGPFAPRALPRFIAHTGLSATRHSPACPSPASGWRSRTFTVSGFPCCVKSPCTCMPSPLPRRNRWILSLFHPMPGPGLMPATAAFPVSQAGRLPHYPFRGLLSVHSRYGLHARRVAQGDPLYRRLQPICHLLDCSDCYRLERPVAGWESHPL